MSALSAMSAVIMASSVFMAPAAGNASTTPAEGQVFEVVVAGKVTTNDAGEITDPRGVDSPVARGSEGNPPAEDNEVPVGVPDTDPALASDPAWNEIARWRDRANREVILRRGTYDAFSKKGWGLSKIQGKHNLNERTTRFATARYDDEDGNAVFTDFNLEQCRQTGPIRVCRVLERARVKTVVGRNSKAPLQPKGVITSLCLNGTEVCPDWLKRVA